MKVLHCLAQLPSHTGSGIYYSILAKGLKESGHENAFLYATQEPFKPDMGEDAVKYEVKFLSDKLEFPIAGMSDEMPYNSTIYSQMSEPMLDAWHNAFKTQLIKAKAEFKPDIVLSHHLFMLTSLVKQIFSDTPVIGIAHGTDLRQIKKYLYFREKYMEAVARLEGCIAIAPKDLPDIEKIVGINKNKVRVMGGGFNSALFYKADGLKDRNDISLLYAGKISASKGVYELASAIPQIIKRLPETLIKKLSIEIVGNADPAQTELLNKLSGNFSGLRILPALPQTELAEKMRKSDIFILPSYYEGLGLVNIEALASGCLVVTTEIEALIWLLGDKINASGVVEYVKLPRLFDTDKPYEEDKPEFINRLADKITAQIERACKGYKADEEVYQEIAAHSWKGIIAKTDKYIRELKQLNKASDWE